MRVFGAAWWRAASFMVFGCATSAFACCGAAELQLAHFRSAFQVELVIGALSAVACVVAVIRHRWWLCAAFLLLVVSVPAVTVQSDGCGGSLMNCVWSAELGCFLWLGPLSHRPGQRWSHASRVVLMALCAALLAADWSREGFSSYWVAGVAPRLLVIPLWALWLWVTTWVLTRPLLPAFAGWRTLLLVERRVLLISLVGATPLALVVTLYSSSLVLVGTRQLAFSSWQLQWLVS